MSTILVALGAFFGFIIAYNTYGKWLSRKIFQLDPDAAVPSHTHRDDVDFVPTSRDVVFGHHFTSIAGTGPIVGPAIAVFWGWLPALLWVVFGSIFVGAVHDFGALVISMRHQGQTIGDTAGKLINPRTKILFLLVLCFALMMVLGVFGLVIALIFALYPETVLSVWVEIPLAIAMGLIVKRTPRHKLLASIVALAVMYVFVYVGAYHLPITLPRIEALGSLGSPVIIWTALLLLYCFVVSIIPVHVLLQPRDYLNSHQLMMVLAMLVLGLFAASLFAGADIMSAPAIATDIPGDAPPVWPFLFITIACGACSGFHSLVSSGTTSKQNASETDARQIGYGAMLLEGALATLVILACTAGLGMGSPPQQGLSEEVAASQTMLVGRAAWESKYQARIEPVLDERGEPVLTPSGTPKTRGGWKNLRLPQQLAAFIEGGANFLKMLGIPFKLGIALIAVLIASFAATTLDTATRLQRYLIQELIDSTRRNTSRKSTNKYLATAIAVGTGFAVALIPGPTGPGSGGLILWPLFGATNQLLAGLALMVLCFYLWRRSLPVWFALPPALLMLVMPGWAMMHQMFTDFLPNQKWLLLGFGVLIQILQFWMIMEALLMWPKVKGILEEGVRQNDEAPGVESETGSTHDHSP